MYKKPFINSIILVIFAIFTYVLATSFKKTTLHVAQPNIPNQKIQVAVLLDVSNSMDGLISQAKAQLWNMVNTLGKAKCNEKNPEFEIALYEYGRPTNDQNKGYIKQINSFITSLDSLSENLFSLTTNGGDEYCGQVIYSSLNELPWDQNKQSYKVIFIAGNEDFLQGKIQFTEACKLAKEKGVIVNTIYCGDKMQGIREHWNLGGECGNGSYTNINANAKIQEIITPYDSLMYVYNNQLNGTYIAYGFAGVQLLEKQARVDNMNMSLSKEVAIQRTTAKAKSNVYKNAEWDLVDAAKDDDGLLDKISLTQLPDSLKNKSKEALKTIVQKKSEQRTAIQKQIIEINAKREAYIAEERKKLNNNSKEKTLETEVEIIIKEQAKRFNMVIQ